MTLFREQRSLFGEILDWMLAPLLLLWPMSVVLTWLVAQGIANKPFDRQLGEMTRLLSQQVTLQSPAPGQAGEPRATFTLTRAAAALLQADEADRTYYQVQGLRGELLDGDADLPTPAVTDEERSAVGVLRFRDEEVRGEAVRLAFMYISVPDAPAGLQALVQVAETPGKRSRLAADIIKGVMLPQFVILPLAVLLVWLALVRGIKPLNEIPQRIYRRDNDDLSPIDESEVPEEVLPLVRSINDLLRRLDKSLASQKQFLADAAHQLKTPLAGLRTQAELAQQEIVAGTSDPQALRRSLQQIARSSQRATRMVNQLLAMARAEDDASRASPEPAVSVARIAAEAVHDFVPRALEKRIDLGYEGPESREAPRRGLLISGQPVLLRELVRNLVDNALSYTPEGGTVTVRVVDDPFGQVVVLQVEDSGPGIAPSEHEKVFQPFYRALGTNVDGSGLGLAIVRKIAQAHGASLALTDAHPRPRTSGESPLGPGACFTLRFPASPR